MSFMIIGHGKLSIHKDDYVNTFESSDTNVITFAPPTAGCMYAPDSLQMLREGLSKKTKSVKDAKSFFDLIQRVEKKLLGLNYCDDEWIGFFSEEAGYDQKKGCGLQVGTILNKTMSFEDDTVGPDVMGVWDLNNNRNLLSEIKGAGKYHSFSDIVAFLHEIAPTLFILDCTCSVLVDANNRIINPKVLPRFKRRAQRNITNLPSLSESKSKSKRGRDK